MASHSTIRIGGASAAWGDSPVAVPQLVAAGVDYLVFDYLAEQTMTILAAARAKNPELGYAADFVTILKASLPAIVKGGIKVVSNAGGLNPQACARALKAAAEELGLTLSIGTVSGDDVMPQIDALRQAGARDLQSGRPMPERLMTANAYLGALPIKAALDAGAQVVITGRCVDSAVTLGVMMHAFGWQADQHDLLAAGSLAGHIIECGCQATGGIHTDWQDVPDWGRIGYPIVEAEADGRFIVTKPENTGGLVAVAPIAEQVLYEVGDPARYILPDVVCDFTQVSLSQAGPDRVAVSGARGLPPTDTYKVCATYADGFKSTMTFTVIGFDAAAKGRRMAEAILQRCRDTFRASNLGDFSRTQIEAIGAEAAYGPHAVAGATREVVLRLAVAHPNRKALDVFAGEIGATGVSWAPGVTGISGRPKVSPAFDLFSFLVPKDRVAITVSVDGREEAVAPPPGAALAARAADAAGPTVTAGPDAVTLPLVALAYGRSGDKGDSSNIALIARHPELLPLLRGEVTAERVRDYLSYYVKGAVTRFEVPGLGGLNFLCDQALDGGVAHSLRNDPWGKGMAQILLSMPVRVPPALARYAKT